MGCPSQKFGKFTFPHFLRFVLKPFVCQKRICSNYGWIDYILKQFKGLIFRLFQHIVTKDLYRRVLSFTKFLSIISKSIMHERKWVQLTKLSIRFQNQSRLVVEVLVWWCNFSHIYVKLGSVQICTMSKEWIESSIIGFSFKCVQYKIFYFLDFRNISYPSTILNLMICFYRSTKSEFEYGSPQSSSGRTSQY